MLRLVVCMIAALALCAGGARAQTIGVASVDDSTLARRLSAELRTRGYDVRALNEPGLTFSAILTVEDDPPSIRVCAVGGECERLSEPDASVLLIRAVEIVRARVGEPRPQPVETPVETAPAAPEPEPPSFPFEIAIALSLLPPTGSFATGLGASIAFDWSPNPILAFEAGALVSFVDPEVDDEAGTASAGVRMLWLGADVVLPESLLAGHRLRFGLATALAVTELDANAAPPLEARDETAIGLVLMARIAFILRLVDRVGLLLGVRAGLALPRPVVVFTEREVAEWGAPFVSVDAGPVFRF